MNITTETNYLEYSAQTIWENYQSGEWSLEQTLLALETHYSEIAQTEVRLDEAKKDLRGYIEKLVLATPKERIITPRFEMLIQRTKPGVRYPAEKIRRTLGTWKDSGNENLIALAEAFEHECGEEVPAKATLIVRVTKPLPEVVDSLD